MGNMLKLKAKIVEKDKNLKIVAKEIGVDKSTLYRKVSCGGDDFTIREINELCNILDLDLASVNSIFFEELVAKTQT